MRKSRSDEPGERFSLVAGGPFHAALRRFGLIGADQFPSRRAAVLLALLAWLPPALLAVLQSVVDPGYACVGYFTDLTVPTRYLIAIWALIATERVADSRIVLLTRQFREAEIVPGDAQPRFEAALASADRRSSSAVAELVLFAAALIWSGVTGRYAVSLAGASWEGTVVAGEVFRSWAGEAARFVSSPLFLFLVLRWLWRFLVWAQLLYRVSRLPLRLIPLHPDRAGGLGFLSVYPKVFSGFIFALSCVVSSSVLKELNLAHHSAQTVWAALAVWLGLVLVLFLGPLFVFARPLYLARERAILDYGRLAHQHHLAFERKWVGETRDGKDLLGSPDSSSASDLNACVQTAQAMHIVPVDLAAVVQLVVTTGIPLLAVVAREIPLIEIVKWIVGTVL